MPINWTTLTTVAAWVLVLTALLGAIITPSTARSGYRETQAAWPSAKRIWTLVALGLEALMCSLICFGIVGILGFTGAVPTVLLWVAGVFGTLGTLLAGTGAISAVLARLRYGI